MQPGAEQNPRATQPAQPENPSAAEQPQSSSRSRPPRAFQVLRILVTVLMALILVQAITAGQLLAGTPGWRAVHGANAMLILLVALAQVVTAILIWRPGRGTLRLLGPTIGILVVLFIQAYLGDSHNRAIHVPLGVLMFGGTLVLVRQLWSQGATPARAPAPAPARESVPGAASGSTPAPVDGGTT